MIQQLITSKDETSDIPVGVGSLSKIVFSALQEFNLATMKQTSITEGALVQITGRFAGTGIKGLKYAVSVTIMGGPRSARVLLNCYAENDAGLTGFHHAIINIIEKRTRVKQYLTDKIIIQHIKGDYIEGDKITIKDSVVQKSKIG